MKENKQWKRVPFDIELAKKIQSGEIEGRIVINEDTLDTNNWMLDKNPVNSKIEILCVKNNLCIGSLTDDNDLFIELPEETPICSNPDSPKCKICSNWHCNDCQYNASKHEFKPFDKVLVRDNNGEKWVPDIFRYYDNGGNYDYPYRCCANDYRQCIPYKGNQHLLGTTNNPK